ncbi:MAG: DinB family protein [Terriglobia bacterium]
MITDHFQKMFDYDLWANQRALESMPSATSQDEALRFMGHIVGAHRIWLERFNASTSGPAEPWPKMSVEECGAAIRELHSAWRDLLSRMTPEKLAGDVSYRNSKGVEFKNPVADVLTHLVNHSSYHRGQVATAVRQAGGKPASTDYIVYVRQQAPSA